MLTQYMLSGSSQLVVTTLPNLSTILVVARFKHPVHSFALYLLYDYNCAHFYDPIVGSCQ